MRILAMLLVCCSCGSTHQDSSPGDTINVKVNESFEVKLSAVMASGSSWSLADSAFNKMVVLDTTYTVINPSD
ncbi:MAG: hypothetical protein H7Y01_00690 [Ferruginibacter sp.]|nr:hypothetical protein [Chitinophagaceae bacterium]